jgi:hypothetical protein
MTDVILGGAILGAAAISLISYAVAEGDKEMFWRCFMRCSFWYVIIMIMLIAWHNAD